MVGVMAESIRFPGSMALAAPWTSPNWLGTPGRAVKSSISLLSRNPAPVTVTRLPYRELMVVVTATAFPGRRSPSSGWCAPTRRGADPAPGWTSVRRRRPVGPDLRPAPPRTAPRPYRPAARPRSRVGQVDVPVGERAPRGLGVEVHVLGGEEPGGQVVPLQDVEHEPQRRPARRGRAAWRPPGGPGTSPPPAPAMRPGSGPGPGA
jgi:hypothetical protein